MAGEIFALIASCCSFCSALSWEARELSSIRLLAISLQSTLLFKEKPTMTPSTVISTTGRIQLGRCAMLWNVSLGEKNTPIIRPKWLIGACACGAGTGVVAIKDSSTTSLRTSAFSRGTTHERRAIFQWGDSSAKEGKVAQFIVDRQDEQRDLQCTDGIRRAASPGRRKAVRGCSRVLAGAGPVRRRPLPGIARRA